MEIWFAKVGAKLSGPELNPIEYTWDELECRLHPRPPHQLINAVVAERTVKYIHRF